MQQKQRAVSAKRFSSVKAALMITGMLATPALSLAQSAVVGSLGNFDAANFEGKDAHGMEVQIEGIVPGDLFPAWCGNKYGCPITVPYATGVYVRYMSPYDSASHTFTATTVPHAPAAPFGGTCYMGSVTYSQAGCDHFGVHLAYTVGAKATVMSYRWMFEDVANPGQLIATANNIFVPTPVYTYVPPVTAGVAPVLIAEIQAPPPPPPPPARPPQFGNAVWMKVFKTELGRQVALDELTGTNAIVPQDVTQTETEWVLIQPAPPAAPGDNRRRRNRHVNSGGVGSGTRSVLRRYETYAYTGAYDPLTHEVVCGGDATCSLPQTGELGDMLIAQMTAANVSIPSMTVAITGNGSVSSADKAISCPNRCTATYAQGAATTLTAKAGSNSILTSWTGACSGTAVTCTVAVTDALNTGAVFTPIPRVGGGGTQYTVQVGRSNSGTVTSDVAGLNCGSACSAKFDSGTVLTLTATPPSGKAFVNWSGACTGTSNACTLTVTGNLSVTAVFSK